MHGFFFLQNSAISNSYVIKLSKLATIWSVLHLFRHIDRPNILVLVGTYKWSGDKDHWSSCLIDTWYWVSFDHKTKNMNSTKITNLFAFKQIQNRQRQLIIVFSSFFGATYQYHSYLKWNFGAYGVCERACASSSWSLQLFYEGKFNYAQMLKTWMIDEIPFKSDAHVLWSIM